MKCFEILRYAVHFRYTMLCCFIYLGKTEICMLHIILLLLCVAGIISGSFRPWSASLVFSWVLPKIRRKKWCWSKDLLALSTRHKTTDRGRHMGKHTETIRQRWSAWMTVWCPDTSSLALVTLFHNLCREGKNHRFAAEEKRIMDWFHDCNL